MKKELKQVLQLSNRTAYIRAIQDMYDRVSTSVRTQGGEFCPFAPFLVVFPLLSPYNTHKLDSRSHECLLLGYSTSYKGYKCISLIGRMFVSKDVLFNEFKYPYLVLLSLPFLPLNHPHPPLLLFFLPYQS